MNKLVFFFTFLGHILLVNGQTKTIIYFDSNKSELKKDSKQILDSLLKVAEKKNSYKIEINAYCDNTGSDAQNQALSEMRADAVYDYLKNKKNVMGIILKKGFGESFPIASNDDENGKAKNRRAEISLTISPSIHVETVPLTPPAVNKMEELTSSNTVKDLEIGETLVLKDLNFEGGTANLLPEAKPSLKLLLNKMKENPTLEIEIGGHVCCADDMPLSVLRAKTVYDFLVKNGISKTRLKYKGYSRKKPIVEDDSNEAGAKINRRVEITIFKK